MANHAPKSENSYPPSESGYPPATTAYANNPPAPTYAPATNAYTSGSVGGYTPTPTSQYQGASYPSASGQSYASSAPAYPGTYAPSYTGPPPLQPNPGYQQPNGSYSSYGYGQSATPALNGGVQLPQISAPGNSGSSYPGVPTASPDTTGQLAPPGMKPRVTATLWEDEGSLCFQVEAEGVCVARREDNHFINGTKLLNVAGMTRGRRDGILKSEKMRHVVKIGPMHLKGVWIPFDRALEFANKEKITQKLYPLFVHDIGSLLYHPTNRGQSSVGTPRFPPLTGPPLSHPAPAPLHHHHSIGNPIGAGMTQPPQAIQPHPTAGRPGLDRAHTFPTPPTSASSLMGGMPNQGSSQDWGSLNANFQGQPGSQPLAIDTGLARSVPATPASTPPGNLQPAMSYPSSQGYENSRLPMYPNAPPHTTQYQSTQPQMMGYRPESAYGKHEMAPPARAGEQGDVKPLDGMLPQGNQQVNAISGDDEGDHQNGNEYTHTNSYGGSRPAYAYTAGGASGPVHAEHLSSEAMTGSPQQNGSGSGRQTPRTTTTGQSQWNYSGMNQRQPGPSSNVYNVMASPRGTASNGIGSDGYAPSEAGAQYQNPTHGTSNGISASSKRTRDEDDHESYARPDSAQGEDTDPSGMKRRRTMEGGAVGPTAYGDPNPGLQRARTVATPRRR